MQHTKCDQHWHTRGGHPADRRCAQRETHVERVTIATQWGELAGALIDVSATGGQVRIAEGLVPFEGDEVTLRFVGAAQHGGRVVWVVKDCIGVVFDEQVAGVEELLWLEQRGPEWYSHAARPFKGTAARR